VKWLIDKSAINGQCSLAMSSYVELPQGITNSTPTNHNWRWLTMKVCTTMNDNHWWTMKGTPFSWQTFHCYFTVRSKSRKRSRTTFGADWDDHGYPILPSWNSLGSVLCSISHASLPANVHLRSSQCCLGSFIAQKLLAKYLNFLVGRKSRNFNCWEQHLNYGWNCYNLF
jgi:hypothetical protein